MDYYSTHNNKYGPVNEYSIETTVRNSKTSSHKHSI